MKFPNNSRIHFSPTRSSLRITLINAKSHGWWLWRCNVSLMRLLTGWTWRGLMYWYGSGSTSIQAELFDDLFVFPRCCFASTAQQLMANDATSGYQSWYYRSNRKETHLRVSIMIQLVETKINPVSSQCKTHPRNQTVQWTAHVIVQL